MDVLTALNFNAPYWEIILPAVWALADIITGFIKAQVTDSKNSSVMRKGLYRKSGELLVVFLAWLFCAAVAFPYDLAGWVAAYIVFMETLSILENLKASGVPIPDSITNKVEHAMKEVDNDVQHSIEDKGSDKHDSGTAAVH